MAQKEKPSAASDSKSSAKTQVTARTPADRPTMPPDFSISLKASGGTDEMLRNPRTKRIQSMRGYEDHYVDIIDWIVRITHRCWEEKDIGYIYSTYRHNAVVYDDYGLQYGRDKIVADTVHTINAFPDIRLYADEIIWAGDDEKGFHTSHRTVIAGTNTGYSKYGPPTGRRMLCWCIANCSSLENEMFAEWVIYDTASMLYQLGYDLREMARKFGNEMDSGAFHGTRSGEAERQAGQDRPQYLLPSNASGFDVEEFIRRIYHNIWNRRSLSDVRLAYHPSLQFIGSTGRSIQGRGDYQSFILSILAMFPDLAMRVDEIYWMGNDDDGYLASVRWNIQGTHKGNGIYGQPTNRPISMWGITQHQIVDGKINAEWMLFNEFVVMQQIFRD